MRNLPSILLLFPLSLSGQNVRVELIQADFPKYFSASIETYEGRALFQTHVNDLPHEHYLAELLNEEKLYVDYLLQNYLAMDWKQFKEFTIDDTLAFRNTFYQTLETDSVFNMYFLEQAHYFLRSRNDSIRDHKVSERLELSLDSLASIASRFFHATSLAPDGKVNWNICVGKNGHHGSSKNTMVPLLEAFCFQEIYHALNSDEPGLMDVMRANAEVLHANKQDREGEKKLLYYRNGMYALMAGSNELKHVLLDAYEKKKGMLNFVLL